MPFPFKFEDPEKKKYFAKSTYPDKDNIEPREVLRENPLKINISEKYKTLYFNIPKCGSTTLMRKLESRQNNNYYTEDLSKYQDYKKLVVLRDPMSRVLSMYNNIAINTAWFKDCVNKPYYIHRNNFDESFQYFLDELKVTKCNGHFIPQYRYIEDKNVAIEDFDYIILFKNLQKDIKKIYNFSTLNDALYHNYNKKRDISKFREQVYEIYKTDFELYDYVKKNKLCYSQ